MLNYKNPYLVVLMVFWNKRPASKHFFDVEHPTNSTFRTKVNKVLIFLMLINEKYQKMLKNAIIYYTKYISILSKQTNLVALNRQARVAAELSLRL
jgi:hypothetical protein